MAQDGLDADAQYPLGRVRAAPPTSLHIKEEVWVQLQNACNPSW